MIQQRREQHIVAGGPDEGGSWEPFFGYESALDYQSFNRLDRWTADDLLSEALKREANDPAALRIMQTRVLVALLDGIDRE